MNRFIPTSPEKTARPTKPSYDQEDEHEQYRQERREQTDHVIDFNMETVEPLVHQMGTKKHKIEVAGKMYNLIHLDEDEHFLDHRIADLQNGQHPNWHYEGVSTKYSFEETVEWTINRLVKKANEWKQEREVAEDNLENCYREKHEIENELSAAEHRLTETQKQMAEMRRQMDAMRQALIDNRINPTTLQPLGSAQMTYREAKEKFDNRHETIQFGDNDSDEEMDEV